MRAYIRAPIILGARVHARTHARFVVDCRLSRLSSAVLYAAFDPKAQAAIAVAIAARAHFRLSYSFFLLY